MRNFYVVSVTFLLIASITACNKGDKDKTTPPQGIDKISTNAIVSEDTPNLKVLQWGPNTTTLGTIFNKQIDGESAIWFELNGAVKPGVIFELWFGDVKLSQLALNKTMGGAAKVPTSLLYKAIKGSDPF